MTEREGAGEAGGRGGAGGRGDGGESGGGRATSSTGGGVRQPSEEELRAALEAELKQITVGDVLLQTVVSLLNVGGRKAGLAPGTEGERDLAQVHAAIEGVRALLPVVERSGAAGDQDLRPIRDALSQLQLAYAKLSGEGGDESSSGPPGEAGEPKDGEGSERGPAQSSGRLWVPGQ